MSNYYNSIDDMPIYNWRKCSEKEELQYCRIDINKGTEQEDIEAWDIIYDSFLAEFGLGKDYKRILELQMQIAEAQCDFIINDDQFLRNRIKQLEIELNELLDKPVVNDMDTVIIHLEKWRGFAVDEKNTTVRKFYKLLREYQKEIERIKKAG